jgi:tripartite-type tricarboxylate transporter receptor subunit TctC
MRTLPPELSRRRFLHLAGCASLLITSPGIALAQTYPSRPVRWIVGYPAGGGTDILVRLLGQSLAERFGQPFVIENRAGANSNIATEAVVRAPADGYMLLGVDAAAAINATLYDNLGFNFIRDITVVGIVTTPQLMMVHPTVPARTVPEFIAWAKANPGKISMASAGVGNSSHLAGELFKAMTHIDMTHVPYRGGAPALSDLLGGQVQVYFGSVPPALDHVRAGRLRALGVTTAERFEALPDIATVSEFLPGYEASQWYALGVRKDTPAEIIDKLGKEIGTALADPKMKARLLDLGDTVVPGSLADFASFITRETEKWGMVVKFAGVKAE